MNPIWLQNAEYLITAVDEPDHQSEIGTLRLFIPMCERWISENRVAGSIENQAIVQRALRLYTRIVDWSLLRHDHAAADLRNLTIRLKNLLKAA